MPSPITLLLAAAGAILMVVPYHYATDGRPMRLIHLLTDGGSGFRDLPSLRAVVTLLFICVGIIATLLPAILSLLVRIAEPPTQAPGARVVLGIGGAALLAAAALCLIVIVVSTTTFGWGASTSSGHRTIVTYLAPLLPTLVGLTAIASALRTPWASFIHRLCSTNLF